MIKTQKGRMRRLILLGRRLLVFQQYFPELFFHTFYWIEDLKCCIMNGFYVIFIERLNAI